MDFFPGRADHLSFDLLRDDNHPVDIGEDEVAGGETDAIDLDGHVEVHDALAMFAVINTCCSREDRKPHGLHLAHVANGAINDGTGASTIYRGSREQLSPDAGTRR